MAPPGNRISDGAPPTNGRHGNCSACGRKVLGMRRNGTAFASLLAAAALAALAACSSSGSDAAITSKVRTVLQADRVVDDSKIHVTTERGVVTHDGSVAGEEAHDKTIELVERIDGVRQVRD
jgi:hypothetical protein